MAERAKHAHGSRKNLENAIAQGVVNEYDVLFLSGEGESNAIGWVSKDGDAIIIDPVAEVSKLEGELKTELATKVSAEEVDVKINTTVTEKVETVVTEKVTEKVESTVVQAMAKTNKYEILNVPKGTLVDYGDKEIRVMVPANAVWEKQTVGATGNANMYYMAFRAYAPEGAVGFKEGDKGVIVDEYFDFSGDFAGTDEFGRNYSVCWFALAMYDEASDTWSYFGKSSNVQKYLGWDYIVEWYDAEGVVIESDCIRIGLANEDCYFVNVPYYIGAMEKKIEEKITEEIAKVETKIEQAESSYEIIEF